MTTIANAEVKLDQWGMGAWIALLVLGFFIWWPLGLATLAYVIWSGRMRSWRRGEVGRFGRDAMHDARSWWHQPPSSGNHAFDEYRTDTLRRLEEEQREFRDFLERLRLAKDKSEFDQFMADRRAKANSSTANSSVQPQS